MIDQNTQESMDMKTNTNPFALFLTTAAALMLWIGNAQAQDKYGETPEQQELCKESLNNFISFYKQKDFNEAYNQWNKVNERCPAGASQSFYAYGLRMLDEIMSNEQDAGNTERVAALQDSILMVYDWYMEYYPSTSKHPNNRCEVLADKANDYYDFFGKDSAEVANAWLKEAVDCLGAEADAKTLSNYYITSFYAMKNMEGDAAQAKLAEMLTEYLTLADYCDAAIAAANADGDERNAGIYEKVKGNIDQVFVTIANCEEMVPVLQTKYDESPEDMVLLEKILRLLNKKECTDNALYLPVATAVHAASPSSTSAYSIGINYAKAENYSEAFNYLEQAVELCPDCGDRATYILKAGQVASFLGNAYKAKSYANQLLEIDSENADAYMLIGDAIAGAAKSCDDGALGMRAAYWVAADYYARARSLGNEEVSERAAKKIANCEKQFPTVDDIFTVGKSAGDSFKVGSISGCPCAGETTRIRVR